MTTYFIEHHEMYKGKIMYYVCSCDLNAKPLVIHVYDICHTVEEAERQLDLVKKGEHPTQTHPAGSLWTQE